MRMKTLRWMFVLSLFCCGLTVQASNQQPSSVPGVAAGQSLDPGPELPVANLERAEPEPTELNEESRKDWEDLTPEQKKRTAERLDLEWRAVRGLCFGPGKCPPLVKYKDLSPAEQKKRDEKFRVLWDGMSPVERQELWNRTQWYIRNSADSSGQN